MLQTKRRKKQTSPLIVERRWVYHQLLHGQHTLAIAGVERTGISSARHPAHRPMPSGDGATDEKIKFGGRYRQCRFTVGECLPSSLLASDPPFHHILPQ